MHLIYTNYLEKQNGSNQLSNLSKFHYSNNQGDAPFQDDGPVSHARNQNADNYKGHVPPQNNKGHVVPSTPKPTTKKPKPPPCPPPTTLPPPCPTRRLNFRILRQ